MCRLNLKSTCKVEKEPEKHIVANQVLHFLHPNPEKLEISVSFCFPLSFTLDVS